MFFLPTSKKHVCVFFQTANHSMFFFSFPVFFWPADSGVCAVSFGLSAFLGDLQAQS